jgi:hypothetical protein
MQAQAITANFADGFGIAPVSTTIGAIACGQAADQCGQPLVYNNLAGSGIKLEVRGDGPGTNWFAWHDRVPTYGGLGASNDAGDNSSDNIFSGESVILDFDVPVTIFKWWSFNHSNGASGALNGAEYTLDVDASNGVVNDALVAGGVGGMVLNGGSGFTGSKFVWENTGPTGGLMYVSAIEFRPANVPEPASLGMLGVALLTFVGMTRRRRTAA